MLATDINLKLFHIRCPIVHALMIPVYQGKIMLKMSVYQLIKLFIVINLAYQSDNPCLSSINKNYQVFVIFTCLIFLGKS